MGEGLCVCVCACLGGLRFVFQLKNTIKGSEVSKQDKTKCLNIIFHNLWDFKL